MSVNTLFHARQVPGRVDPNVGAPMSRFGFVKVAGAAAMTISSGFNNPFQSSLNDMDSAIVTEREAKVEQNPMAMLRFMHHKEENAGLGLMAAMMNQEDQGDMLRLINAQPEKRFTLQDVNPALAMMGVSYCSKGVVRKLEDGLRTLYGVSLHKNEVSSLRHYREKNKDIFKQGIDVAIESVTTTIASSRRRKHRTRRLKHLLSALKKLKAANVDGNEVLRNRSCHFIRPEARAFLESVKNGSLIEEPMNSLFGGLNIKNEVPLNEPYLVIDNGSSEDELRISYGMPVYRDDLTPPLYSFVRTSKVLKVKSSSLKFENGRIIVEDITKEEAAKMLEDMKKKVKTENDIAMMQLMMAANGNEGGMEDMIKMMKMKASDDPKAMIQYMMAQQIQDSNDPNAIMMKEVMKQAMEKPPKSVMELLHASNANYWQFLRGIGYGGSLESPKQGFHSVVAKARVNSCGEQVFPVVYVAKTTEAAQSALELLKVGYSGGFVNGGQRNIDAKSVVNDAGAGGGQTMGVSVAEQGSAVVTAATAHSYHDAADDTPVNASLHQGSNALAA